MPAVISAMAALTLVPLSRLEHRRSVSPSDLILGYLLITSLFEATWLAAPSTRTNDAALLRLLISVQVGVKTLLLIFECLGKDKILLEKYQQLPPTVKSSVLGKTFFWW